MSVLLSCRVGPPPPTGHEQNIPQVFCDALKGLPAKTPEELHAYFNEEGGGAEVSYLVWYCRCLTAGR